MEYISTYLREYAERYSDFGDVECHMVTCNDGSTHQVYTTLPTLLLESAATRSTSLAFLTM